MQKAVFVLFLSLASIIPSLTMADTADEKQEILRLAYEEGSKVGYPETIVAMAKVETSGGTDGKHRYGIVGDKKLGFGKRAYGVMQVRLGAARDTLKRYPYLGIFPTDEHLIVALMTDNRFNIRVASHYYKMKQKTFGNWRQATIAYNAGDKNARRNRDPKNYANKVWANVKEQLQQKKKKRALWLARAY